MSDVFISYSRRDSEFMAKVHARLTEDGHDVWVDWEDIPPTADWWQEIRAAIEEAHVFAFIISPNSVQSDICRDEIQYAIDNNKRFIPILYQEIEDVDAAHVHPAIRSHNWISFLTETEYEKSFTRLIDSFTNEPDYLRRHTRLLVHAREWQENNRQPGYLLKGEELREFQQWLALGQVQNPKPTELQYDYILASQTQRTRDQLRLAGGVVIGVVIVAILSVFAYLQQQQISAQNAQGTISAQEQAFIEATVFAAGTRLAAQGTRIADVQVNATNIIVQANVQNTQSALQSQILFLQETIEAYETFNATTPTPLATSSPTPTETATATVTPTSTLPPTWTPEPVVEDSDRVTEENGASAASFVTATLNPDVAITATVQQEIYATATQVALVSPTPVPTNTRPPTATLRPSPTPPATRLPPPTRAVDIRSQSITYVVQQGDFAVDIAERFGVSVAEIVEANNLRNASLIFVGQQLLIPYLSNLETDSSLLVAPTGEDTPDCGSDTMPCGTVAHAMAIADGFPEIRIAPGVYMEALTLNDDVVLVGNGMENTILTGDFSGTIITVNPDVSVTIIGMTITGGDAAWGGGIANYGDVSLQNVRISGNVGQLAGGGIANFGTLTANYVEFLDNFAPYFADFFNTPDAEVLADDTMEYIEETAFSERSASDGDVRTGILVEVSTTEGDRLNLRPQPDVDAGPPIPLNAGTPLIIIDGPEQTRGFRWWQVQTINGDIGWVADFDDEVTLTVIDKPE